MSTKPVAKTHPARVGHAVQTVLVWVMAVIFLAPLYFVVLNSFKTKGEISISATTLPTFLNLENYARILEDDYFVSSFLTSVAMVVVVTSLTCLVAAMAGYALARWKSKLSTGLNLAIMSTLFVPFQVYMVAMIIVVRQIGLTGNLIGLALVYIAMGMPVPIFLARSYATGMSIEIEEAAIIDADVLQHCTSADEAGAGDHRRAERAVGLGRISGGFPRLRHEEAHDPAGVSAVFLRHLQQPMEPDPRGLRCFHPANRNFLHCDAEAHC